MQFPATERDVQIEAESEAVTGPMCLALVDANGKLVTVFSGTSIDPAPLRRSKAAATAIVEGTPNSRPEAPIHAEFPAALARGGLPPLVMRRVCKYIETHLEQSIRLKHLADVAGLSVFHFARAFKQMQGVTPTCYLLQRRIEQAQKLLAETDASLSEIAVATGFSDQSHFARRFRDQVGTTPTKFRWSRR